MEQQVRFVSPGRMGVVQVPEPRPGAGEVRVRIERCGICGSDLHVFRRDAAVPTVCPGHEMCGVVDAIGAGVEPDGATTGESTAAAPASVAGVAASVNRAAGVRVGDRVVIEPLSRCGRCARCLAGDYHLCSKLDLYGVGMDGGMASHVLVPAYTLFALPDALDFEMGALAEPTAVTVHAARLGGVREGSRVLILGAGTIGLLALASARHLGASFVAITARHPHQREMAEALGADQVLAANELRSIREKPDVVIETVGGAATTVADAVLAVQRGGTVVIVGLFDSTPAFDPFVMLLKEVRLIGSMVYNRPAGGADFAAALDVLVARASVLRRLITHTVALGDVQQGFELAADKKSGAIKVLLAPQ